MIEKEKLSFCSIIFLFVLFIPFIANIFCSNVEILDNRPLYKKPTKLSLNYSKDFELYYNDHIIWRKWFIRKYKSINKRVSTKLNNFINGKNGWMFYNSLYLYFGESRYNKTQLEFLLKIFNDVQTYYDKKEIKYIAFIASNKENIYPEFMEDKFIKNRVSNYSKNDVAVEFLKNNGINFFSIKDELLRSKNIYNNLLYYKKDTHWNDIGAFIGYIQLLKELRKIDKTIVEDIVLNKNMIKENGVFSPDMDLMTKEIMYKIDYKPNIITKNIFNSNNGKILEYYTENAKYDKTILCFRDSFMGSIIPYMVKDFKRTIFLLERVKSIDELEKLIIKYKPDIVIDEAVERSFDTFFRYDNIYGNK